MSNHENQLDTIVSILKSEKMKSFINSKDADHTMIAATQRLISKILESDTITSSNPDVDFDHIIYGEHSSPLAQNDSEDDILVKALVVGIFTKKKLGIVNDVIDNIVASYGLTSVFESLLQDPNLN